jgi:protein involved in polysaccharide export with SLBB domain
MRILLRILGLLFIIQMLFSQNFMQKDEQEEDKPPVENQKLESKSSILALEKAIDPNEYILGPGDQIGLSINNREILTFSLTVTPTGDLFIPAVGVYHVAGYTLAEAISNVQNFIRMEAFPKAKSEVVLLNPRKFKMLVSGAVNAAGFITVSPLSRLDEAISLADGFHQLAKEYEVNVIRADGRSEIVNYHNYLLSGDLKSNPTFLEGDRIQVPFGALEESGIVVRGSIEGAGYDIISKNESLGNYIRRQVIFQKDADLENVTISRESSNKIELLVVDPSDFNQTSLQPGDVINFMWERGVTVTGFVQEPGGFTYYPGYSVTDYIALAGGNTPQGNPNSAFVKHNDGTASKGLDADIMRGDVIYVPRTTKDIYFGDLSILQMLTATASIYLAYLATVGK